MVAPSETRPTAGAEPMPVAFRAAVAGMHAATLRPEVWCEEMPAPQRIAPYATALSADVTVEDTDVGTGRLILLHDPAGHEAWGGGTFRCVAYARAEVDLDQAADEMLGRVSWSWLTDALEEHGAEHMALSGTVTRVSTENFGSMAEDDGTAQVEIRASWTPLAASAAETRTGSQTPEYDDRIDMAPHVEAWGELLCTAAGLPPVPDGVAVIPTQRGQRGTTS